MNNKHDSPSIEPDINHVTMPHSTEATPTPELPTSFIKSRYGCIIKRTQKYKEYQSQVNKKHIQQSLPMNCTMPPIRPVEVS